MIKIGDAVAYMSFPNLGDIYSAASLTKVDVGIVYHVSDSMVCVCKYGRSPVCLRADDDCCYYQLLSDDTKENFIAFLNQKILHEKSRLKTLTFAEKENAKKDIFDKKKKQIIATAKNMIEADNDFDFINKLKEIARMKKALFEIKTEDFDTTYKYNNAIKYGIRILENLLSDVEKFDFKDPRS